MLALETASATPAEAHDEIIGRVVVATDREPHGVARPDPQQARMQRVAVAHARARVKQLAKTEQMSRYRLDMTLTERRSEDGALSIAARVLVVDRWRQNFQHIVNTTASATPRRALAIARLKSRLIQAAVDKAIDDALSLAKKTPRRPRLTQAPSTAQLSMAAN